MPTGVYLHKKGWKHTEGTKRKIGEANSFALKGKMPKNIVAGWFKGKHFSEKHKKKISESHRGEKNPNWKGGIHRDKHNAEWQYIFWRKAIFQSDDFVCQICKQKGGQLEAHHLNNWSDFPELRFAIDNGITLCKRCHNEFHKKYGRKNNTKGQYREFLLKGRELRIKIKIKCLRRNYQKKI